MILIILCSLVGFFGITYLLVVTNQKKKPKKKPEPASTTQSSHPTPGDDAHPKKPWWEALPGWTWVGIMLVFLMVFWTLCHMWSCYERGEVVSLQKRAELQALQKDPTKWTWIFKSCQSGHGSPEDIPDASGYRTLVTAWAKDERGLLVLEFWYENRGTGKRVIYTWRRGCPPTWEHEGRQHPFILNQGTTSDSISGTFSGKDQDGNEETDEFVLKQDKFIGAD